jgi:nucleotidyltransferase/DNA polymerase involved in DNA repair
MTPIKDIEGIGKVNTAKFEAIGINTVEQLLEAGKTLKGREDLAIKLNFSEHHILKFVNYADLFRVPGIARQYAELLESAGVDSVLELAQRRADHLHEKLKTANETRKQVHVVPGPSTIQHWIDEAKKLPRVVTY